MSEPKACAECPWRRTSAPGYLGGNTTETYVGAHRAQEPTPCHMRKETLCAGNLITLKNSAASPQNQQMREAVASCSVDRETFFAHWSQFDEHHANAKEQP